MTREQGPVVGPGRGQLAESRDRLTQAESRFGGAMLAFHGDARHSVMVTVQVGSPPGKIWPLERRNGEQVFPGKPIDQ